MEVYLLFSWIGDAPVPALLYLSLSTVAGVACMRLAKAGMRDIFARLRGAAGITEAGGLLTLGKLWFVGALLLFPGYLTDIAAVLILLLVGGGGKPDRKDGQDDMVEVRGRLLDDD